MMLTEMQQAIQDTLTATGYFKEVGIWQGDLESATKNPARFPAAWVIFTGARLEQARTIGATEAPAACGFVVVVVSRNLVSPGAQSEASYALVEAVLAALTRLRIGTAWSWADSVELVTVERGITAYAVHVTVTTNP